jgi:hypothetical protein
MLRQISEAGHDLAARADRELERIVHDLMADAEAREQATIATRDENQ